MQFTVVASNLPLDMNVRVSMATHMRTCIQGYLRTNYLGLKKDELREDGGYHVMRSPLHRVVLRWFNKDGIFSTYGRNEKWA